MIDHPNRLLAVAGAHNVRDLGGYATSSGGMTQWRRLLRSAALHQLGEEGRERLVAEGLRTVVDLRSDNELHHQPSVFARHPGVAYVHLPLYAALGPAKMGGGDEPPFSMAERYCDALENCGAAFRTALTTIAEADDGIVLFNCTAGKDRTGLIAALILSAAGVDETTIVADYVLTATVGVKLMEELLEGAIARGHDREHFLRVLAAEPAFMETALSFLAVRYGGVPAYLDEIGVSSAVRQRLADRLIGEGGGAASPAAPRERASAETP